MAAQAHGDGRVWDTALVTAVGLGWRPTQSGLLPSESWLSSQRLLCPRSCQLC